MKSVIISLGAIFFIILVIVTIYLVRKGSAAKKIKLTSVSATVDGPNSTTSSVAVNVTLTIGNYSPEPILLNQASFDVYTPDEVDDKGTVTKKGEIAGSQVSPLKSAVKLVANDNTPIKIPFAVYPAIVSKLSDKIKFNDLINFTTGGKLGKKIRLVGFIVAEGFKVNIDEVIEI